MASNNSKISELTALTTVATGDKIPIVDISDLTDASTGTTKRITWGELVAAPGAIGGTTANTIRSLFDPDVALSGTLTANQCSGGVITNYGQGASDTTVGVPTAFAGGNFLVVIGTAQAANDYILDLATGTEVMYLDGTALGAGKSIYIAAPTVGAAIQFIAQQTGASTYQWFAYTIAGAWTGEA
jgi:hypothetical protein